MTRLRWAHYRVKRGGWFAANVFVSLFLALLVPLTAIAQHGAAISQGFTTTDEEIAVGALVSFEPQKSDAVELANIERVNELAGVVVEKPLVSLESEDQTLQVATNGLVNAIVSDINGEVKAGDKITASPINGVGMKATDGTQIVGIAQTDLSASEPEEREITAKDGMRHNVRIGSVPLQVNVTYYAPPDEKKTVVPLFLQQLANSVAGKEVSLARLAASGIVLLLAFVSVGTLLYASIRSSIISIGRNPLSERAVHKSLFEVGGITIGVLLVMLCAIYLILVI